MLSKLNFVKFAVRGVFALRCVCNRRIWSPSALNAPYECSILSQQRQYSQRMFYHNPEAHATGAKRQQYLLEQQKTTKYQPLICASGAALSKRTAIPSMITHQRHLGRMQILLNGPRPSSELASSNSVDILRWYMQIINSIIRCTHEIARATSRVDVIIQYDDDNSNGYGHNGQAVTGGSQQAAWHNVQPSLPSLPTPMRPAHRNRKFTPHYTAVTDYTSFVAASLLL